MSSIAAFRLLLDAPELGFDELDYGSTTELVARAIGLVRSGGSGVEVLARNDECVEDDGSRRLPWIAARETRGWRRNPDRHSGRKPARITIDLK